MNIGSVRCLILPVTEIVLKALVVLFGCVEGKEKIIETSYVSQNSNGHVFRKSPKKQNDFSFFYTLKTMLVCRKIKPEASFITQNFPKHNLLMAKMLLDTLFVLF